MTEIPSPTTRTCPQCKQALPPDAPEGLCPECLMLGGLETMPLPEGMKPSGQLPESGEIFGGYRIGRELGRGGMGAVFEAEQLDTGRRVALKLLNHQLDSPESRARFLREGRLAASINHPNSVYVFGTEEIGDMPAIAMELVGGGTLEEYVKEKGALSIGDAVDAALQVIEGLEAAQEVGILHRDVKPGNCFLDVDGSVKIGDYGLSISTEGRDENHLTMEGTIFGTPAFSSPEQLRGEELNVRSDIYAVGATLFYLLSGRPAFRGKSIAQLFANVLEGPTPNISEVQSGLPSALIAIVSKCLQKMPAERFSSYAELRKALAPFSSEAPVAASLPARFIAGAIDFFLFSCFGLILQFLIFGGLVIVEYPERSVMLSAFLISLIVWVSYFGITEGRWGSSLGKKICRLKVINLDGNPPGIPRAMIRAFILMAVPSLPTWISTGIDPFEVAESNMVVGLSFYLIIGLLFVTARKRNGLASVCDLLTKTRVARKKEYQERPGLPRVAVKPVSAGEESPRIGPFHILEPINDQWLVAYDTKLLRKVWVRTVPENTEQVSATFRQLGRPGRLRWLSGRRSEEENWDAFECPGGKSFQSLANQGSLPWSQVRYWLLDIAQELKEAHGDGTMPDHLSLDRVWITDSGRAKLLDFALDSSAETSSLAPNKLLEAMAGSANRPLPIHATRFQFNLESLTEPEQIIEELEPLIYKTATVSKKRRVALVAACVAFPLFCGLMTIVGLQMFQKWNNQYPKVKELSHVMNYWVAGNYSKANRDKFPEDRLFSIYIASKYRDIISDPVQWNSLVSRSLIPNERRAFAERSLIDYPDPTPEEVAQATAALESKVLELINAMPDLPKMMPLISAAVSMLIYVGIPAIIAALLFRGGLLMLTCGVGVVRQKDGARASRLRCFWRSLITWAPWFLMPFWLLPMPQLIGFPATVLIFVGLVFGLAILSLCLPNRSLQDRLAGTCLVPR